MKGLELYRANYLVIELTINQKVRCSQESASGFLIFAVVWVAT